MGLFQPIVDAIKLLFKEDLTPAPVNKGLYFLAPMISVFVALVTFIVIPFGAGKDVTVFGVPLGGLIVAPDLGVGILYLLALPRWACTGSCSRAGRRTTSTRCSVASAPRRS